MSVLQMNSNPPAVPPPQSAPDASPPEQTNNRWVYIHWTLSPFCSSHVDSHLFVSEKTTSCSSLSKSVAALIKSESATVTTLWRHSGGRAAPWRWRVYSATPPLVQAVVKMLLLFLVQRDFCWRRPSFLLLSSPVNSLVFLIWQSSCSPTLSMFILLNITASSWSFLFKWTQQILLLSRQWY